MKTLKFSIIALGVIAALIIGGYLFIKKDSADVGELTKVADEINERSVQVKTSDQKEGVDLNMRETEVQVFLHQMTHQHVIADKKWGSVESSPENVENLLTVVQVNQDAYEHGDYYIEVLEQWQQGDFSNSVEVHNTIWNWHGGTIGKATGLLNEN